MGNPSTKNFNVEIDKKLACTCGDPRCNKPVVMQSALNQLQLMRDDYGRPIKVTSGARCPFHPNEQHRPAGTGDHQKLETFDIECLTAQDETKLKVLAGRHGATRVAGTYKDGFIHVCFGECDRTDVPTWEYGK